jgi:hypothetical protein
LTTPDFEVSTVSKKPIVPDDTVHFLSCALPMGIAGGGCVGWGIPFAAMQCQCSTGFLASGVTLLGIIGCIPIACYSMKYIQPCFCRDITLNKASKGL